MVAIPVVIVFLLFQRYPMLPHGMSVILNAPAVFRFTAAANPERHLRRAPDGPSDAGGAGTVLADAIIKLMRAVDMPAGLPRSGSRNSTFRADSGNPAAASGTKLAPRPASEADLSALFADAYW